MTIIHGDRASEDYFRVQFQIVKRQSSCLHAPLEEPAEVIQRVQALQLRPYKHRKSYALGTPVIRG